MHQVSTIQLGVRVKEPICGDQVNPGMVFPAGQQRLQHASRGGLAHRHAARDTDDERHRLVGVLLGLTEELCGGGEQPLPGRHLKVDQPCKRQIDLFDLEQVDLLTETAQLDQLVLGQLQRCRHAQRAPLTPVELHVGLGSLSRGMRSVLQLAWSPWTPAP